MTTRLEELRQATDWYPPSKDYTQAEMDAMLEKEVPTAGSALAAALRWPAVFLASPQLPLLVIESPMVAAAAELARLLMMKHPTNEFLAEKIMAQAADVLFTLYSHKLDERHRAKLTRFTVKYGLGDTVRYVDIYKDWGDDHTLYYDRVEGFFYCFPCLK